MACESQPPQICTFFFWVERFELVLFILSADGDVISALKLRDSHRLWRGIHIVFGDAGSLMARLFVKRFYRWKQSIVRSRRVKLDEPC